MKKIADKMPSQIKPMLTTLIKQPFDDKEWAFEIKLDGYRAISEMRKKAVSLYSRNLLSFHDRFPVIYSELKKLNITAIFDGEIVILDERGKSNFQLMQNYPGTQKGTPLYFVFDLIFFDGKNLCEYPLLERKEILQDLLDKYKSPFIRYNDHILERGKDFYQKASELELEGIIGKNIHSPYHIGMRSREWVKIKTIMRQEAIICGFTAPKGGRKRFGSLVLGIYQNEILTHVGEVGTGFNDKTLEEIYHQLIPLIQEKCPFPEKPKISRHVTWIKPKIVCEIAFTEWTDDNSMRHPVFKGIRIDKKPYEVIKELPLDLL